MRDWVTSRFGDKAVDFWSTVANGDGSINNFYDYESDFIKLWAKMGREVLEKNISTLPGDRRKKNSNRIWGANYSQKPSV